MNIYRKNCGLIAVQARSLVCQKLKRGLVFIKLFACDKIRGTCTLKHNHSDEQQKRKPKTVHS